MNIKSNINVHSNRYWASLIVPRSSACLRLINARERQQMRLLQPPLEGSNCSLVKEPAAAERHVILKGPGHLLTPSCHPAGSWACPVNGLADAGADNHYVSGPTDCNSVKKYLADSCSSSRVGGLANCSFV